jgi:hypothetical protein
LGNLQRVESRGLNLFPPFVVLAKARSHTRWLERMRDVRTALLKDPLPIEVVRNLLSDLGDAA